MNEIELSKSLAAHNGSESDRAYSTILDNWFEAELTAATNPQVTEPNMRFEAIGRLAVLTELRTAIKGMKEAGQAYLNSPM